MRRRKDLDQDQKTGLTGTHAPAMSHERLRKEASRDWGERYSGAAKSIRRIC